MILPGGAQNIHIVRQFRLRVRCHRASNRRPHPDDSDLLTDFEHAFEPAILDEAVRFIARIYV